MCHDKFQLNIYKITKIELPSGKVKWLFVDSKDLSQKILLEKVTAIANKYLDHQLFD